MVAEGREERGGRRGEGEERREERGGRREKSLKG